MLSDTLSKLEHASALIEDVRHEISLKTYFREVWGRYFFELFKSLRALSSIFGGRLEAIQFLLSIHSAWKRCHSARDIEALQLSLESALLSEKRRGKK